MNLILHWDRGSDKGTQQPEGGDAHGMLEALKEEKKFPGLGVSAVARARETPSNWPPN